MGFQSGVSQQMGFGVPGEYFTDAPWKAETFTINSASAAYNNIGSTCCSVTGQTLCAAGAPAGNFGFAGFLVNPKGQALYGVGNDPLAPTLNMPNQKIVECLTMGSIVVRLPAAAVIGNYVVFDNTTGAISTISTAPFVLSGGTTSTNTTVTMADTTGVFPGQPVTGAGIPANTTVVSVTANTSIVISQAATATATVPLTFTPSGKNLPAGKTFANAIVDYFVPDAVGGQLAVLAVNPTYVIPS